MHKKLILIAVSTVALLTGCGGGGGGGNASSPTPTPLPTPTPTPTSAPTPTPTPAPVGHSVTGELKQWHNVMVTVSGLFSSETASTNPFTDYNVEVTFTQGAEQITVPGYFAACGDAEETGCTSGSLWRAHFAPHTTGTWNYSVSFKSGADVAITGGGTAVTDLDGLTGTFDIADSDKTGRDFRAPTNGRLSYTDQRYLTYPDGRPFFKLGANSPENTLAYEDFDATPNRGMQRKNWAPHAADYVSTEASIYTWNGDNGSELLGAWSYLANQGVNAVSFLTFGLGGEDDNVFPHLLEVSETAYETLQNSELWDNVHHDRFDVSKLAQWEKVFSYADQLGLLLHVKTMEEGNDELMDDGNALDRERRIYYRELIARFGHHLGLQWNIGQNYSLDSNVAIDTLDYIQSIDPYDNLRVVHTLHNEKGTRFIPLIGNASELTGASLHTSQLSFGDVRNNTTTWINHATNNGKLWVVSVDEQGSDNRGIATDNTYTGGLPSNNTEADGRSAVRSHVLWNILTAGGAGTEYFYGANTGCTDQNCQDHRTRANKWRDGGLGVDFFNNHIGQDAFTMAANDALTGYYPTANIYLPNANGIYSFEAEDAFGTNPPAPWVFETTPVVTAAGETDFTGSGYYLATSAANSLGTIDAGEGILTYIVEVPPGEASDYRLSARLSRPEDPRPRTDTFNDIWVRVIEFDTGRLLQPIPKTDPVQAERSQSWWKLFFSGDRNTWQFPFNLDGNNGEQYRPHYNLNEGRYIIQISVRSINVRLDRISLRKGLNPYRNLNVTTTSSGTAQKYLSNSDYVLAEPGENYVIYSPWVDDVNLDLRNETGFFTVKWYNPRTGGALIDGSVTSVTGGSLVNLGEPPEQTNNSWVAVVKRQ